MSRALLDRQALQRLLAAGVVVVAPHALMLPTWIVAVFVLSMAWRYGADHYHWYRPERTLRVLITLLTITVVYRQYGTLLGRDPGMALLITLLGLKFLEIKTARDQVLILFLFYLVVLGSFLYSQSLWLGAWALLAVLLVTTALIRVTQPQGMDLLFTLRMSATLLAKALPLMVVVYVLFPRLASPLWALPSDAHSGLTGISDRLRPGNIQNLSESSDVAFRVVFDSTPPPARELYWRALVLWVTDGHEWQRGLRERVPGPSVTPLAEPVRYRVTLEPSNKPWMLALDIPASAPEGAYYRSDFTIQHNAPINERLTYAMTSYPHYRSGALSAAERARALQLPENVSARVRALAAQWRAENSDARLIARAALDFFHRENFVYTLQPPLLQDDPVDEFLFSTRRGFCEHYASAFTTLMRAAGVPSRLVIGYLGGELNPAGNYLIVRQSDAHAWAEIWLPENGWTRVDPTGAIAPERIELGIEAVRRLTQRGVVLGSLPMDAMQQVLELGWLQHLTRQAQWYWDLTNVAWYRWVIDYSKERQERFLNSFGLDNLDWGRVLRMLLAGVLLGTLIYALALLRPKKTADPALALYRRYCHKLRSAGLVRASHEGALDFARRCHERRPDLRQSIDTVTELYLRARYAASAKAERVRALRRAVVAFKL